MISTYEDRISPVLDVARRFLLIDAMERQETGRQLIDLEGKELSQRVRQIGMLGVDVLICGAVTRRLEVLLWRCGVQLIPNTCGRVDDVLAAFLNNGFDEQAFLMPGCGGRRRRRRFRGRDSR